MQQVHQLARRAIRERGGYSLMPEWETSPANQYLPRQVTPMAHAAASIAPKATPPAFRSSPQD